MIEAITLDFSFKQLKLELRMLTGFTVAMETCESITEYLCNTIIVSSIKA